jgi:hypothetical protein
MEHQPIELDLMDTEVIEESAPPEPVGDPGEEAVAAGSLGGEPPCISISGQIGRNLGVRWPPPSAYLVFTNFPASERLLVMLAQTWDLPLAYHLRRNNF